MEALASIYVQVLDIVFEASVRLCELSLLDDNHVQQ